MTDNKQASTVATGTNVEAKLLGFWETNGRKFILILAAIAIISGGFFAYRKWVEVPKENKAADAMFHAENYFRMDSVQLALNGDNLNPGFLKVISKYSGTKAANLAHFYAGSCYLKMGDFNNAVKQLKDFSTDAPQIAARASSLLGDAYSELGKKAEAAEAYKKAGTLFSKDDYNSPEYLFRAGFLYETMGKNKEAIEMYKLIKDKYARSDRGFTIDKYLARLGEVRE